MICCNIEMDSLATADRPHGDRVTVYRCPTCERVDSRGHATDRGWVGARERLFLELREEAFARAGLVGGRAMACLDLESLEVLFSPRAAEHLN